MNHSKKGEGAARPRVMSGIRVTGPAHIGNFFGAIRNWIDLQNHYECYFGVMDWHGMTTKFTESSMMNEWTRDLMADLVAWGVDVEKSVLYVQSQVPETLELLMILSNIAPLGALERVTTWKDAIEEAKATDTYNLGRFAYPVLQTADIALFRGTVVPVGKDQVAHLELCREIVRKFNRIYKGALPEPDPLLTETPLVVGTDGRKMSKSYGNVLHLTEERSTLEKIVKKMMTDPQRVRRNDPGNPEVCPVYSYHKLFTGDEERQTIEVGCRSAGIGCGDCKAILVARIEERQAQPRERKKELLNNKGALDSIISKGNARAREEAQKTLSDVRAWMRWR